MWTVLVILVTLIFFLLASLLLPFNLHIINVTSLIKFSTEIVLDYDEQNCRWQKELCRYSGTLFKVIHTEVTLVTYNS